MTNPVERQLRILERNAAHGAVMRQRQAQERAAQSVKAAEPGDRYRYA